MWTAVVLVSVGRPVCAPPRFFEGGDVFADLKRFCGDSVTNTVDGTAGGGGGVFITPNWSLGLDVNITVTSVLLGGRWTF